MIFVKFEISFEDELKNSKPLKQLKYILRGTQQRTGLLHHLDRMASS